LAIADLYYVRNVFITVYEKGKDPVTYDKIIPPWESLRMSNTSLTGTSLYNSSSFFVFFHNIDKNIKSVTATYKDIDINLQFRKNNNQEGMVSLSPFNNDMSQFFYSHKQYNYDVYGYAKIGSYQHLFNKQQGVMD
jgi:Protein of unknown function (DUF2804).